MNHKLRVIKEENSWFDKGLKFKCTGCGRCCTGSPGYVWLSLNEIEVISKFLKLSVKEFKKKILKTSQRSLFVN